MVDLNDSVALVTGGASGLGEATIRRLHAAGAGVVIFDKNAERGTQVASELGAKAVFADGDVTSEESVRAGLGLAREMGALRVVVNCAGSGMAGRTVDRKGEPHDFATFEWVIRLNLIGTFNVSRLGAAQMAKNEPNADGERSVIVNTASIAAYDGQVGQVAYAASKGGVVGMTLSAARDLASFGIRVSTIAPGIIDTPMLAGVNDEFRATLAEGVPFPKRLGRPDEYADLAVMIAEHDYLNGEVIRMDGALRMAPR
jgi:NAD(P)-dependent dehydrogenase (short-subunit alcohol dehydrogenase family)